MATDTWTCRAEPLSDAECLTGCNYYLSLQSCGDTDCAAKCSMGQGFCATHGGLSNLFPHCAAGGKAWCSDGELVSF